MDQLDYIHSTGTSFVVLNGVVGKGFKCMRWVRKGDPLSPFIFVIAADLLQSMVNKPYMRGIFMPPPYSPRARKYPSLLFNMLMTQSWWWKDVKGNSPNSDILQDIHLSRLKVNFHKSCLVPLNMSGEKATSLANTFGCQIRSFPFTYLALPMGLTKPQVKDYAPLLCKIERRFSTSAKFLSYAGRLQLVNSVISSLSTY